MPVQADSSLLAPRELPQAAGILRTGPLQFVCPRFADRLHLLRAEAKQGGDVPDFVELSVVFHVKRLNIASNDSGQHSLAHVHNLLCRSSADRTEIHQM